MPEQENRRITEEALAAINAHDPDRYLEYLDDSYVWENDVFPEPVQGREAARQVLAAYFAAIPDVNFSARTRQKVSDSTGHSSRRKNRSVARDKCRKSERHWLRATS